MKPNARFEPRTLIALLSLCALLAAEAQTTNPPPSPRPILPRLNTLVRPPAARASSAAKSDSAATPGEGAQAMPLATNLAAALRAMNFERTPEALVEATRARQSGRDWSESERFRMAVLLGDWSTVSNALAALPLEDAVAGYNRLLEALAGTAQSASDVFRQSTTPVRTEDPGDGSGTTTPSSPKDRRALLVSEDFYAVIDAAPADLKMENLPQVASMVRAALGVGGKKTLLARLAHGWKGLGGQTPEGGKLAAQLLSSCGWITDAAPWLPLNRDDWAAADTLVLILTLEHFTQTGIAQKDERQLQRAAEVCAFLMQNSRFGTYTSPLFKQATDRLIQLLPALEPDAAKGLIREQFLTQPATLADLVMAVGETGQSATKGTDLRLRESSLNTQNLLLQAMQTKKGPLPETATVLVMNWIGEAEQCYRAGGIGVAEMTPAESYYLGYVRPTPTRNIRALSAEAVLGAAPPAAVVRRLNPGLAQRVELTALKVNLLQPKETTIAMLRDYLQAHPGLEREICQDFLTAWSRRRTKPAEDPEVLRLRSMGVYIPYRAQQQQQQGSGGNIPLTRLRQNQNIEQFKSVLGQLRELSPEPIDPALVVQSFMNLHSGAEVYRVQDIEAIFGPPEKMVRAELVNLLSGMRLKLREQWRDMKTQQEAGSNRTEQEAKDEVSRGYRTALELARRGIQDGEAEWRELIARGQLFFDAAEYEFTRQIKLTDYVSLRDESFTSYRKAAGSYAAKLAAMPRGQWTVEPYQMWFFVMLGASDLSQLTPTAVRTDPGLKSIGEAMRALPGEAAEKHVELFGKMLGDLLPRVPANVRQRFLHTGLQVVGEDNPAAKAATTSLKYYQELLDEIQLRVTVDGPTRVGHSEPFGVFIGLEATRQLVRESGGFTKYLQNPGQQRNMMFGAQPSGPNHREDFARNVHAALDETFEVRSLTFHDAAVKLIDLPRDGWQETPLAYAVLRAKNPAVDRIPSIQIDMDFLDQPGQVVLPVLSQVQPIDAKDVASPARPCEDLRLTVTMDEREWRDGKVVVEVLARGRGIIPSLNRLFDFEREGFDLEMTDNGLSIGEYVSDGKQRLAQADRNWQLTYRRKKDLRGDVTFHFPQLKAGTTIAGIEHKHYQDADLVALNESEAKTGVALSGRVSSGMRTAAVVIVLAGLGFAAWWFVRQRGQQEHVPADVLAVPAQLTPFSAVAFLRRLQHAHTTRLGETDRAALATEIHEIESAYFSNGQPAGGNGGPDLASITRKWLQRAA